MPDPIFGDLTKGSGSNVRVPVVLCLDVSNSMGKTDTHDRIGELNAALQRWKADLGELDEVRRKADICLLTFSDAVRFPSAGPEKAFGFVSVAAFDPPQLQAGGVTRLDLAVEQAIAKAHDYRSALLGQTRRPKIWLISDGAPTDKSGHPSDDWRRVLPLVKRGEAAGDFGLYAAGVADADSAILRELAGTGYYDLKGLPLERVLRAVTLSIDPPQARAISGDRRPSTVEAEKQDVARIVQDQQDYEAIIEAQRLRIQQRLQTP